MITTAFCLTLITAPFANAADKAVATAKKDSSATNLVTDKMTGRTLSASDLLNSTDLKIDATIGFVESFSIMGECQEGQAARKEIEYKRDLATQEIQDEAKKFEKSKSDYLAKSTTMTDSAREKAEKQLVKMERELKNLVAEKEEEIKVDMQLATETLAQSLEAGVTKLAQSEGLDVVFDKMTGRAIYVSDKFDYTSEAIKQVNKNYEVKLAQNKQAEQAAVKVADNKAVTAPKATKVGA